MAAAYTGYHSVYIRKKGEDLIRQIACLQEKYQSPSVEEFDKITPFSPGDDEEARVGRVRHMTEITVLTVELVIEFAKRVPGFDALYRKDQITLLKVHSSELMMLKAARKYNTRRKSIVFGNSQHYCIKDFRDASMNEFGDAIFSFCENICALKPDDEEFALLSVIVLFSESPYLFEPKKVEKIQDFYVGILRCYIINYRPKNRVYFPKLLSRLAELRALAYMNSKQYLSYKLYYKKPPTLLEELWNDITLFI